MPDKSGKQTILWPILSVTMLVIASCGDIQDPSSGVSPQALTNSTPSYSQTVSQASEPAPQAELPLSEPIEEQPASQSPLQTNRMVTDGGNHLTQGPPRDGSQPEPVEGEHRTPTRTVTLQWDHSPSGDAFGYKVYVTNVSTQARYYFFPGLKTQVAIELPVGERYSLTVFAYNAAGESLPSNEVTLDLF